MRSLLLVLSFAAACSRSDDAKPAPPPPAPRPAPAAAAAAPPIDDAIKTSTTEHKPLVVEFYTSWCKPCEVFERTALADDRVKAALKRVVFVRYDAESGQGITAAARFHVSSYPTFLAIDQQGNATVTQTGLVGDGIVQFLSLLDTAGMATMTEAEIRKLLAAKPDAAVRLQAASWFTAHGNTAEALGQLDLVATDRGATEAVRGEARTSALRLRRTAKWHADLVAEKLELARTFPRAVDERALALATIDSGAPAAATRDAIAKVLAAQSSPDRINGLLYVALAAGAKDEALAAAKRVLADTKDANLLDTLAECYHAHGDKAEALRVEDRAIAVADQATKAALAANRARFASGSGDSDEVTKARATARELDKQLAGIEAPPSPASDISALQRAAEGVFTAIHKLGGDIATACKSMAGKSTGAFARVALDDSGKITSSTIFLDGANDPLRACIAKQLATAKLPVIPGMPPQPIEIRF